MAGGTQGGGVKRSGSRGTVPSAGRAPGVSPVSAAPITAAAFTAAMLAAGGDELQGFWLAQDGAQWVTYESGFAVSSLIGQVTVLNSAGSSGANCPTLIPGGAEGGRDALRFTLAAASRLLTGAVFADADGERWGIASIGRINTTPPASLARLMSFIKFNDPVLALEYATTPQLQWKVRYDDGGAGVLETETAAYSSSAPLALGVFASDLHVRYLNGVQTELAEGAGIVDVGGGNQRIAFGRGGFGDFTGGGDFDLWCAMAFKSAGDEMPAGFDAMMALASAYYDTPALSGAVASEVRRNVGGGTQGTGVKRWAPPFPIDGLPMQGIVRDSDLQLIARDGDELLLVRG